MEMQTTIDLLREKSNTRLEQALHDYEMAIKQGYFERLDQQLPQLSAPLQTLVLEGGLSPEDLVETTLKLLGGPQVTALFSVQELVLTITLAASYLQDLQKRQDS